MNRSIAALSIAIVGLVFVACQSTEAVVEPTPPGGLESTPSRLAFVCVTPGCSTTEKLAIVVKGTRRIAIKRIFISGDEAEDFSLKTSEPAPFVLGAGSQFEAEVTYVPKGSPHPSAVELRVTYTDAAPDESPDRVAPGELKIPLLRRLVGEPALETSPAALSFGFVAAGESKTLDVRATNEGTGNIVLELQSVDAGHPTITAVLPEQRALQTGAHLNVPVTFAPVDSRYIATELALTATSTDVPPTTLKVEGTSIPTASLATEPTGELDFGELGKGKQRTVKRALINIGGTPLEITSIAVTDATGNLQVAYAGKGERVVLQPLQRLVLDLNITGNKPGEVDATVTVRSNSTPEGVHAFRIRGTITEPKIFVTPLRHDFGTLPVGWAVKRTFEIKNVGWGPLTIKRIAFVGGSSNLFTLDNLPTLPATLQHDQRIAVEVQFRAEAAGTFKGFVSVESDDPNLSFAEAALNAVVGSCAASCPIANGTASCRTQTCQVDACFAGYYDTDKSAANGCECKEPGTDPGSFCGDGPFLGVLNDNDSASTTYSGILPTSGDVDVVRFFAEDGFALFDDDFIVKVRLDSSDPGIKFCVYRHEASEHQNECHMTEEVCPNGKLFEKNGASVSSDSADFVVKVFRVASSGPTCSGYTLFMSNGI